MRYTLSIVGNLRAGRDNCHGDTQAVTYPKRMKYSKWCLSRNQHQTGRFHSCGLYLVGAITASAGQYHVLFIFGLQVGIAK
jgi:hypothetical protein